MTSAQVGVFRLIDPPPGQADIIRRTVDAIDYPWWRLLRATWADPDGAILVKWLDTGQGVSGLFYGSTYEIHLSSKDYHVSPQAAFVFAHEVGHLVDRATFDIKTREAILAQYHTDLDGPHDGKTDPNDRSEDPAPFIWAHESPHVERWQNGDKTYFLRPNEAFADSFVAAFAPAVWDGTVMEGAQKRYPRFAHWSEDFEAIRRLTLERPMSVYDDVPADHPHAENINRAAELGLMGGFGDGKFNPSALLTRAQAATVFVRLHDRLTAEANRVEAPAPAPTEPDPEP